MKSRNLFRLCLLFICVVFFALSDVIVSQTAYAYTNDNLPAGSNVIDIYNENVSKFTEKDLNTLAVAAGYTNLDDMTGSATAGGTPLATKLSGKVVQLGKDNTDGGSDLKWVPVYLSRSTDGDAILTLWLATDIYLTTWSDGTYSKSDSVTKVFNGNAIYGNTYDGSFIRHKLNGKSGWTTDWGDGSAQEYANADIGTMVSDFYGSGALASYVTAPAKVGWQANASYMKNDPKWSGNNSLTANYPCDWVNDNVWLPSIFEVCDKDIGLDGTAMSFTPDGGLWQVYNGNICAINSECCWMRSGDLNSYHISYCLNSSDGSAPIGVYGVRGVRPAVHINLAEASKDMLPDHKHVWQSAENDGWVITKPATCAENGVKERICTAEGCTLTDSKETEFIPATGAHNWGAWAHNDNAANHIRSCQTEGCTEIESQPHNFGDWITDSEATEEAAGSRHRDCAECSFRQTETIPQLNHTHKFDNWTEEVPATCTESGTKGHFTCTCGLHFDNEHNEISDLTIAAKGHTSVTENAVAPTCTTAGKTAGAHCSVCGEILTAQEEVAALGHSYEWVITRQPTEEAEGLKENICTRCNEKDGEEVIAKLVVEEGGNGSVSDLPPDKDYDLEIAVKESDNLYTVSGINKGFKVELFVVDGDNKVEYDKDKEVTLTLIIPEGMKDNFTLYRRAGDILEKVPKDEYKVDGSVLSIRTKLPNEFVFNAPAPEESGTPWWVWLIVGLGCAVIIGVVAVIIVVVKKKNAAAVVSAADNSEVLKILGEHGEKIDELIEISDGGFNDKLDE